MEYLHTMIRVSDLEASLDFFVGKLGLVEVRRIDQREGPLHPGLPRRAGRRRERQKDARRRWSS